MAVNTPTIASQNDTTDLTSHKNMLEFLERREDGAVVTKSYSMLSERSRGEHNVPSLLGLWHYPVISHKLGRADLWPKARQEEDFKGTEMPGCDSVK